MEVYNKYIIDLQNYQIREVPKEFKLYTTYDRRLRGPLISSINRFQNELHWDKMWTVWDAKKRLKRGWKLIIYKRKPRGMILGWVWLSPEGEIKNLYVSRRQRMQGLGIQLVYAALNAAMETELSSVFYRCDIWNLASKYLIEHVISQIGCKVKLTQVEEDYE